MENICEYCQKSLKSIYYYNTHITTCKKNPNKQITNAYTEKDILLRDQKIEFLEQQIKDNKQQIEYLQLQLAQKSVSIQKSSNQKLTNEEPDKAVEPKYKTAIEKYIHVDCKDAMTYKEFINYTRENFTLENFKSIAMLKYEKKYIALIKKMLENIPKKNMPIQIKTNKLNNEEGYIKTGDEFERYFRSELLDQFKCLIEKNGKNNLRSIILDFFDDYKETTDYTNLTTAEKEFCMFSILGFEDNDNETNIDRFPKKLLTLQRNLLDLFMVNL